MILLACQKQMKLIWKQLKAGERDETSAALLPKKREDELSILVAGEGTLSEALLVPLSVKECIFMICRLQQMNEQAEMPDYNEKGQLLYDAVVEKLKMSSSLYILLDKSYRTSLYH